MMSVSNIKSAGVMVGLLSGITGLVGAAGGYYVMQYRVGQLEEGQVEIRQSIEDMRNHSVDSATEIRCLICDQHDNPCPGC